MAIIRDISQRKKIEQQLIRSERLVSIGEMASAMAHEINQPLLSISLGIDNLFNKIENKKVLDESYFRNKSEKIYQDVSRIGRIIDHVRTFSRDFGDFSSSSFDLNESINNAISMISEQFKNHNIHIVTRLDKKITPIPGNTYRFEQVILNLLTNSRDALEEKMKKTKMDFEKTISVRTSLHEQVIRVEVRDNGCGIPGEILDRVMLPFFTTKETGKGTGIGLSISLGIIKEMNGSIEIESHASVGSSFKISLPRQVIAGVENQ
jgi:C4-dicarboxylate-specific signal transduction histidine kinase